MAAEKIKKSLVQELIRQNRQMRKILEEWPARKIMMDFEKEWNERRLEFLHENPDPTAPDGSDENG